MDVKYINPFVQAFFSVMPQLGFDDIKKEGISLKEENLVSSGVIMTVGIVGEVKGSVVYCVNLEGAKEIASQMMMGMPVENFDEMAQSAVSELANMLTANAATFFSDMGITVDISTPTLLYGNNVSIKMSSDQVLCVTLSANGILFEANIAIIN